MEGAVILGHGLERNFKGNKFNFHQKKKRSNAPFEYREKIQDGKIIIVSLDICKKKK